MDKIVKEPLKAVLKNVHFEYIDEIKCFIKLAKQFLVEHEGIISPMHDIFITVNEDHRYDEDFDDDETPTTDEDISPDEMIVITRTHIDEHIRYEDFLDLSGRVKRIEGQECGITWDEEVAYNKSQSSRVKTLISKIAPDNQDVQKQLFLLYILYRETFNDFHLSMLDSKKDPELRTHFQHVSDVMKHHDKWSHIDIVFSAEERDPIESIGIKTYNGHKSYELGELRLGLMRHVIASGKHDTTYPVFAKIRKQADLGIAATWPLKVGNQLFDDVKTSLYGILGGNYYAGLPRTSEKNGRSTYTAQYLTKLLFPLKQYFIEHYKTPIKIQNSDGLFSAIDLMFMFLELILPPDLDIEVLKKAPYRIGKGLKKDAKIHLWKLLEP